MKKFQKKSTLCVFAVCDSNAMSGTDILQKGLTYIYTSIHCAQLITYARQVYESVNKQKHIVKSFVGGNINHTNIIVKKVMWCRGWYMSVCRLTYDEDFTCCTLINFLFI